MGHRNRSFVLLLALLLLSTRNLPAQITATATLQGTVSDSSGAVIPGAEVKITNKSTGQVRTAISNSTGLYSFNLLSAGSYEVHVSMPGFSPASFEDVELSVSRTTTVDARLSLSGVTTEVTVQRSEEQTSEL